MPSQESRSFRPCGVVALLSDFGTQDPYVGIMKGAVLSRAPAAVLVDLTHALPPQDLRRGAWFLMHSRAHFPSGTIFVCVVDPGVGGARAPVCVIDGAQAFVGPDNGLLGPSLSPAALAFELAGSPASATFHGRDLFAPAAGELLAGRAPEELGRPLGRPLERLAFPRVERRGESSLSAEVLFADRFGNLVLSAYERDLAGGPALWDLEVEGQSVRFARTYSDVQPGELLALVDSYAALEIAVREGSAADRLGLGPGAKVILRRRA
ncbi:MAG: SAM-dependent chlorinase/fluorinase [Planctomycetes bacterium]|nr:SAM-dependent chlorinase/fluorinase [Planctomycetota bacterium]